MAAQDQAMTTLLEVQDLVRSFAALRAVAGVSFSVREGELVGLIGPNGAGKSTLYNLIAGAIAPSSGQIRFRGRLVGGWRSYQAARAGIGRTFQIPKPYRHLSVIENVAVSALLHERTVAAARRYSESVLADVGLSEYADSPVGILTVGLLKRLEVARVLALRPSLVLFDEIMAGLTPGEVRGMTALVSKLPAQGFTVIWVEHVLYAIMKAAPRIIVLHRGELIADGRPDHVAKDPAVIKAYLGEEMTLA
jgi:branched-chain amino acid transport system ATP-binding protein